MTIDTGMRRSIRRSDARGISDSFTSCLAAACSASGFWPRTVAAEQIKKVMTVSTTTMIVLIIYPLL